MMYEYFSTRAESVSARIDQNPDLANARKKYTLEILNLGKKLYTPGEKIAWCGVLAPFDLLHAMGVTSCFVEFIGAVLASSGAADPFIKEAEDSGYASDSCAYHRAVTGAMLKGIMPKPDFIIGTSAPCTAGLAVMENMAAAFKKDLFILNIPQQYSRQSIDFVAAQLKEMAGFVSRHTHVPLSMDKLGDAMELANQATLILREIYALARENPSPVDSRLLGDVGTVMALMMGTQKGVDVCKAFRDELLSRKQAGKTEAGPEKVRLMWIQNRIQYKFPIFSILEEMGAKVVADELNDVTWDLLNPERPFESMAKRIMGIPYCLDAPARIDHIRKMAEEYQIQGAINPCHWGCRQGTGIRGLITRGLKDIGIPVLNLEIDCVDSRNLAPGQVRTRLEAFMEMLGQ